MTEPTTEELVQEIKRWPRHPHTPKSNQFLDQVSKRLSDLEGKLGEARTLLTDLHALVLGECPRLLNEDSGGNAKLALEISEALKLTASGGGEDNSLSQGASVAHPSVRPDEPHSTGPLDVEAQLAERLADPEWVAKWTAPRDADRPFWEMLQALRADEGDSVTLLSDNPDFNGQPNNAIECCGGWTDWRERRFTGDTLRAAVLAAFQAKRESSEAPTPMIDRAEGERSSLHARDALNTNLPHESKSPDHG